MSLRLRTSTVRRHGKTYRYFQLARAVRRNGKPTHEIVAHLGRITEDEASGIREALDAVHGRQSANDQPPLLVQVQDIVGLQALRYLDVVVVHRVWTKWGLDRFFREQLPAGRAHVAPAEVVEVLVTNRCLAPCSKLRVTEWMPRTVLPRLLRFDGAQLNNTRIHRVLERLEGIEPELTRFLVHHPIRRAQSSDAVVFLDITDTWFESSSSELAATGKTKDGAIRRKKIQLALGVDEQGLPLRWELLPGNAPEGDELPKWIAALDEHPELRDVPLVFDRGFSSADNLKRLVKAKRRFVTCAKKPRVVDWSAEVDFDRIVATPKGKTPTKKMLCKAGLCAADSDPNLFFVDQGVRSPHRIDVPSPGLRAVLFFRPTQFVEQRNAIERKRDKVKQAVKTWNCEMANARRTRNEHKTRNKVEVLLKKHDMQFDYRVQLKPIEVTHRARTYRAFHITLEAIEHGTYHRDCNAGWMVLLAHPDDPRTAEQLIAQYLRKEAVEYAFKVMKSFVQLRPIRHHTTPKIRAHVTLCVLALLIDRALQIELREAGISDEVDRVYEALEPCRLHVLGHRRQDVERLTITELDERQRRLLGALGLDDLASERAVEALSAT